MRKDCGEALAGYERIEHGKKFPGCACRKKPEIPPRYEGQELESALSVRNLALLGRLLATAALQREESRGAHYRLDFPEAR